MKSNAIVFLFITLFAMVLWVSIPHTASAQDHIVGTKHDLSVSGGGNWTGVDPSSQVCIYCHTPHAASTTQKPLWNRQATAETFTAYSSPTFNGVNYYADPVGHQPQGDSKLCLSCHDGVTALDALIYNFGTPIHMVGGFNQLGDVYYPGSPYINPQRGLGANIGENYPGGSGPDINNLSNDHPISFTFNNALIAEDATTHRGGSTQLQLPGNGSAVKLRGANHDQVECSSCHNVHNNTFSPFLAMSNSGSAMCLTCHLK